VQTSNHIVLLLTFTVWIHHWSLRHGLQQDLRNLHLSKQPPARPLSALSFSLYIPSRSPGRLDDICTKRLGNMVFRRHKKSLHKASIHIFRSLVPFFLVRSSSEGSRMKHSLLGKAPFLVCIISQMQCAHGVTLKSLMFLRVLCDCSSFAWWTWWGRQWLLGGLGKILHLSLIGRWPFRRLAERSNIRVRGWHERLGRWMGLLRVMISKAKRSMTGYVVSSTEVVSVSRLRHVSYMEQNRSRKSS